MPKKHPTSGVSRGDAKPPLTPVRRSARFHINHAGPPASSNPVSPSSRKSQVCPVSHQSPRSLKATYSTKVKQPRKTKPENARRGSTGKGGDRNAEAPRSSSGLNQGHEDALGVSQERNKDGVKAVGCQRGRPRRLIGSSLGMAEVSFTENKEGELKTRLRRSHRLIGGVADEMNTVQPSELAAEVVRDMDTEETRSLEKKGRRKRKGQREKTEEEDEGSMFGTDKACAGRPIRLKDSSRMAAVSFTGNKEGEQKTEGRNDRRKRREQRAETEEEEEVSTFSTVEAVEASVARGRPRRLKGSTLGIAAVSFTGNQEGELKTELRRSHRSNAINAVQPSEVAAEVVRVMDTQGTRTLERNDRRKKRGQREETEEEGSTISTKEASGVECTSKNVATCILTPTTSMHEEEKQKLKNTSMVNPPKEACKRKTSGVECTGKTVETCIPALPPSMHQQEKQKLKNMAKPPIEPCKRKTKKPRTDQSVHKQDTSLCGNGKAIVGGGTMKEGKNIQDWTSKQDKELHTAYIMARPSPRFWKNVSKMVPGKSAKECFNRIHSYLTTPPVPPPRAKLKKSEQSPIGSFSLSGGSSSGTFKENIKKTRSTKQKKILAQKTVRHILKKQSLQEQARETDLFPVFKSSLNISTEELPTTCMSPTPACQLKFSDSPKLDSANSVAAKKTLSRIAKLSSMKPSPEVLKQVKNLALHEKYIDRLHGRVSSWKPSSKFSVTETHGKDNRMPKPVPIKDAKNALLFDAIEAMRQFRRSEDLAICCAKGDSDDEDGGDDSNESGSEDI